MNPPGRIASVRRTSRRARGVAAVVRHHVTELGVGHPGEGGIEMSEARQLLTRVWTEVQVTCQVLPPSAEYANSSR